MQFTTIILFLTMFVSAIFATTVSYDNTYDNASGDLHTVACSDGTNGLLTKHFTTFSSLPDFPNIGGSSVVAGWNSANCGTCWQLTYSGTGNSINILVIDHADDGLNISQEALDNLTNGQAVALGRIDATVTQVDASQCGL
ncbi:hypothetical protein EUX98_g6271 [Antrodiella citrinella]|uniref:Cerato-platanin n=1 Tax=Antrodiella citrinella TaxID=2447956 RepID=A0A4S4MQA8_9APHY|nr:hypothetical protein EUX98_g6271 [Antrodiella citrinella]